MKTNEESSLQCIMQGIYHHECKDIFMKRGNRKKSNMRRLTKNAPAVIRLQTILQSKEESLTSIVDLLKRNNASGVHTLLCGKGSDELFYEKLLVQANMEYKIKSLKDENIRMKNEIISLKEKLQDTVLFKCIGISSKQNEIYAASSKVVNINSIWRSSKCDLAVNTQNKRCDHCSVIAKNKKRYLVNEYTPIDKASIILEALSIKDKAKQRERLTEISSVYQSTHQFPEPVRHEGKTIIFCHGVTSAECGHGENENLMSYAFDNVHVNRNRMWSNNCELYMLRSYNKKKYATRCNSCSQIYTNVKSRLENKRKQEDLDLNDSKNCTNHSSHATLKNLAPETRKKRSKNLHAHVSNLSKKFAHLQQNIASMEEKSVSLFLDHKPAKVHTILEQILDESSVSKETLMKELMIQILGRECHKESHDQMKAKVGETVDTLMNQIKNLKLQFDGKNKQVHYCPNVLRMAISIFNKSKSAYRHLRNVQIIPIPSENRLRQIQAANKVRSGLCTQLYERANLRFGGKRLDGQLIADEMNLTCGVVWNSVTHDIWGFVDEDMSMEHIVTNILSEQKEEQSITKKVNQWLYRSWSNQTFLCEYWYNNGDLNGSEMMDQFLTVLEHCELANFKVHGVCVDAGGSNHGFINLLRYQNIKNDRKALYDDEQVSMVHPMDRTRKIYLIYCITHIMKAVRNQHNKSLKTGSRNLLDENDRCITWEIVRDILYRDKQRSGRGCSRHSKLTDNAVYPDGWLAMMVSTCMAVYSYETISELMSYIFTSLSIKDYPEPSSDDKKGWLQLPKQNLTIGKYVCI